MRGLDIVRGAVHGLSWTSRVMATKSSRAMLSPFLRAGACWGLTSPLWHMTAATLEAVHRPSLLHSLPC